MPIIGCEGFLSFHTMLEGTDCYNCAPVVIVCRENLFTSKILHTFATAINNTQNT